MPLPTIASAALDPGGSEGRLRPGDLVAKYSMAVRPIRLDVTDRHAEFAAARQALKHFGHLDVSREPRRAPDGVRQAVSTHQWAASSARS